jgi:hypothetical protein
VKTVRQSPDLRAVQLLLGHTKLESTVRYLGIQVDDALNIAEQIELEWSNTGVAPVVAYAPEWSVALGNIRTLTRPYNPGRLCAAARFSSAAASEISGNLPWSRGSGTHPSDRPRRWRR